MTSDDLPDPGTLDLLSDYGLTRDDVRRRCPWATEYTGLDGRPCWLLADLYTLFEETEEVDEP